MLLSICLLSFHCLWAANSNRHRTARLRHQIRKLPQHRSQQPHQALPHRHLNLSLLRPCSRKGKVKGLYLTGWSAGNRERMDYYINLIEETELNAMVIDIKNDDGIVSYESKVTEVVEAGTFLKKYDPKQLIEKLHEKDIYVIGRLVCFRDPAFSKKNSDRAVKDINGGLWREEKNNTDMTWLNPCDERNWKYIVDIAKEAVKLGFDEIQFDYVRFPDGTRSRMDFGETDFVKHEVINGFLAYARSEMPDVTLSADIFGIVCVSPGDREDIGQYLELIGKELDYISPMTYPSLYARGQIVNGIKFPNPISSRMQWFITRF